MNYKKIRMLAVFLYTIINSVAAQTTQSVYKPIYKKNVPVCNCEDLTKVKLPNTKIESAIVERRDSSCHVTAILNHPPFNDRVTITVVLPLRNWNGRFHGVGGGGYMGGMSFMGDKALAQGFAIAITDGGHPGGSASFAYNQADKRIDWQNIKDFSYLAVHDMTVTGKILVAAFYGVPAKYSYFVGGSNGGRQALEEVQRYPTDYNGVLAQCPGIYWNQWIMGFLWPQTVMNEMKNFVSKEKLIAVTAAVTAACDAKDGKVDSIIDNPFSCKWDPKLFVGTKVGNLIFTDSDANVVRKIWEGPRGYNDRFLWYGLTRGTNLYDYAATTGDPLKGVPNALGVEWVKYFLLQNAEWNPTSITYSEFESLFNQSMDQYASIYETSKTDISPFRDHGGKLIIAQGLMDNLIPPQGIIGYYNAMADKMGGDKATSKFARLFLFPGVDHMFMGPGPKPVDLLGNLIKWVEDSKDPNSINTEVKNSSGDVIRTGFVYPYKGTLKK